MCNSEIVKMGFFDFGNTDCIAHPLSTEQILVLILIIGAILMTLKMLGLFSLESDYP